MMDELKQRAEAGDPVAQYEFAQQLFSSSIMEIHEKADIPKDVAQTILHFYEKSAAQGCKKALIDLGGLYLYPFHIPIKKDLEKASKLFEQAASQVSSEPSEDDKNCFFLLSQVYNEKGDFLREEFWLKKSSETGNIIATFNLAEMYFKKNSFTDSYTFFLRTETLIENSINNNESESQWDTILSSTRFYLGQIFLGGKGVERNSKEAFKYFTICNYSQDRKLLSDLTDLSIINMAEDYGDAQSLFKAGCIMKKKNSKFFDYKKAFLFLSQSHEKGCAEASVPLAQLYSTGQGCKKNVAESIKLLEPIGNENCSAALELATIYSTPENKLPDGEKKAGYWFSVYENLTSSQNNGWGPWGK